MKLVCRALVVAGVVFACGVCVPVAAATPARYEAQSFIAGAPADTTFVVGLEDGGFVAGGTEGLQDFEGCSAICSYVDGSGLKSGTVYGTSQLVGSTITNAVLLPDGNIEVFGNDGTDGSAWIFNPSARTFVSRQSIGAGSVELGGGVMIDGNVYVVDYLNLGVWESTNGGLTFGFKTLPGENARARGLAANETYIFLLQGSEVVRYGSGFTDPAVFEASGIGEVTGGLQIDASGDMALNSNRNVFFTNPEIQGSLIEQWQLGAEPLSSPAWPGLAGAEHNCLLLPIKNHGQLVALSPSKDNDENSGCFEMETSGGIPVEVHQEIPPGACPEGCSNNERYIPETPPGATEGARETAARAVREADAERAANAAKEQKAAKEQEERQAKEAALKLADEEELAQREAAEHSSSPSPKCIIPSLKGDTVSVARRTARKAHCRLGKISRSHNSRGKLIVTRQTPRAGKALAAETAIAITLRSK
jgi:hypothetical protein